MNFSIEYHRLLSKSRTLWRYCALLLLFFGLESALYSEEWQPEGSLNIARYGATAVAYNGYIYVMGGVDQNGSVLNSVERYDTSSGTWSNTAVHHCDDERLDAAAIVFDDKIFLSGGFDRDGKITDEVEQYVFGANQWLEGEELRRRRRGHVILHVNQRLCVMGGVRDLNNTYEPEIEYLDNDGDWREAPTDLPTPVAGAFAAGIGDKVYLFGGIFNTPTAQSSMATVDSNWNFTWSALPDLCAARGSGATVVKSDSIYLLGGITQSGPTDKTEIYNVSSGEINAGPALTSPRAGLAAVNLDGIIYVIGGYSTSPSQPLSMVESLRKVTGISEPAPGLPSDFVQINGYPNPFNGVVNISTKLPHTVPGSLKIYDIQGRLIRELASGRLPAGEKIYQWDGRNGSRQSVSSGVYFAVFESAGQRKAYKLVFSR